MNPKVDCITFDQSCITDDRQFTVSFGLGHPITSEEYMLAKGEERLHRPPYHVRVQIENCKKTYIFEFKR